MTTKLSRRSYPVCGIVLTLLLWQLNASPGHVEINAWEYLTDKPSDLEGSSDIDPELNHRLF